MTIPAPVGWSARARNAANRLRSDAVRTSGIESIDPPAMGAIGGRLSKSKHMAAPPLLLAATRGRSCAGWDGNRATRAGERATDREGGYSGVESPGHASPARRA